MDDASKQGGPPEPAVAEDISQADINALVSAVEADVEDVADPSQEALPPFPQNEIAADSQAPATDVSTTSSDPTPDLKPFALTEFENAAALSTDAKRVSMLHDVNLRVKIELGRTWMLVEEVLKLGDGSVVELDKLAGDPVDVFVNERLIARGEVLVLNDSFCVRISEVLSHDPHRVSV